MLNINIICVGKLKEKFFSDAVNEYKKRCSAYSKFSIIEVDEYKVPDNPNTAVIEKSLDIEGDKILSFIKPSDFVFSLCIEGKEMKSEEFAKLIEKESLTHSCFDFVIGSSHGLSKKVKDRAECKLSFSKMTFPHQLFRVMLCEQIYRAESIIHGSKYHK